MSTILHIETTTKVCSVALSRDGELLALRENEGEGYSHSSLLTVYMDEALREAGLKPGGLSAVSVSQGPGSYTGLRIGVSAAKGLCYALDIPLIAVDTMAAIAREALRHLGGRRETIDPVAPNTLLCPMIDARRMEVYCTLFDAGLKVVEKTKALVLDENSFRNHLCDRTIFFFGDGAHKFAQLPGHPNALILPEVKPSARGMIPEAEKKFADKDFADLAYFEPFYLKDFVAGKPRVKGLSA